MGRNWRVAMGILSIMGLASAGEIAEGAKAPAFEARDQHGALIRLADFQGKSRVVLYFYPKDDTPGCTAEACSLRDGFAAIQAADAVILGVSADTTQSHKAFAEKFHLPFSILADPDKRIIEAYGVKMPLLGFAKRTTVLIDRQGIIRKIIRDVRTKDHDQQVLALLKALP
ncbi:peroxiredoxin [Geothrix edaphica]|uniref:thioredoxin-dependent peroxiredoxin n=2 Tax=Geothrix edaphica TaxID=2927976 RepID=A0ABQ5PYE3_9BACT|nr:peroxiredoxin [Geothrix edaphica]